MMVPAAAGTDPGTFDVRSAELVLFAGGAVITLVVLFIGIVLFRAASREHRAQLERERREREAASGAVADGGSRQEDAS